MKRTRIWEIGTALILTLVFAAGLCVTACAEAAEYTYSEMPMKIVELDSPINNDDAAEQYIRWAFGLQKERLRMSTVPLSGANRVIYNALADLASRVAAGEETTTICEIETDSLGITRKRYTAEELGVRYAPLVHADLFNSARKIFGWNKLRLGLDGSRGDDGIRLWCRKSLWQFRDSFGFGRTVVFLAVIQLLKGLDLDLRMLLQILVLEICRFRLEGLVDDVKLILNTLAAFGCEVDEFEGFLLGEDAIWID